ncbi:MAG: tetratricopeptide repeat protein [bacterium]
MRGSLIRWTLGAALAAATLPACGGGGDDHILEGRKAVKVGNYEQAIKHFDDALKSNPKSYDALWGKADTYRRDNNLKGQAEMLEVIAADADMMEKFAAVVRPALETNYRKQAQALADGDEAKEALLRKAIDQNKKSDANATLAALLSKKGDTLLGEKKFADAAKAYKAAIELRIPRKQRSQLQGKTEIAEFKAFVLDFMPRFDAVKGELTQAGAYDEKTHTFFVEAEVEVEGTPKDEGYEQNAERDGLVAVTEALNVLSWKVAGKERPEGASVGYSEAVVTIVDKGLTDKKPVTYKFRVSLPQDAVFEQVQRIDRGDFRKPGDAPAAPESAAAPPSGGDDEPEEPEEAPKEGEAAPASEAPASEAPAGE